MNKLLLIAALLFFFGKANAQNLTGLYTGTLFNDTTGLTQNYELSLKDDGNKVTGTSYTTFVLDDKYYYGLRTLRGYKKDGKLILEEVRLLENNFPSAPPKDIRRMAVIPLDGQENVDLLNGMWQTNRTKKFAPVTGLINLRKDEDVAKSALMSYLQEKRPVDFQNDIAIVNTRTTEINKSNAAGNKVTDKAVSTAVVSENNSVKKEAIIQQPKPVAVTPPAEKPKEVKVEKKDVAVVTPPAEKPKVVDNDPPPVFNRDGDLVIARPKPAVVTPPVEKPKETKPAVIEEKKKPVDNVAVVPKGNPVVEKPVDIKPAVVETKPAVTNDVAATKKGKGKKDKEVAVVAPPKVYSERKTKIMQTVVVTADSLMISLYDNGVVDGDVVSVYVNGVNIIQNVKLTGSAYRKTIAAPNADGIIEIKLVAENLGSLPPNTGLMIIQDKESKYHVNFSADMETNAGIIVRKE